MNRIIPALFSVLILIGCKEEKPSELIANNNDAQPTVIADASTNNQTTTTTTEANTNIDPETAPKIVFANEEHNFGTIEYGNKVEHKFEFTNTGKTPLVIKDVKPSCGCTVPETPKEPLAPGEKGEIKVVYTPKPNNGSQGSSVRVLTNTVEGNHTLRIKANVINAPAKKAKTNLQASNPTVSPNAPVQK